MRITDIIRGILDLADVAVERQQSDPVVQAVAEPEQACDVCGYSPCACEQSQEPDVLAVIQHLAGVAEPELSYANAPEEQVAPIGAAFPKGDDMHHSKNPADIRTNAPSMFPGYQAKG